ncbi:MAG: hypothetical protein WBE41_10445, partial [Terracidiphilus sp.]
MFDRTMRKVLPLCGNPRSYEGKAFISGDSRAGPKSAIDAGHLSGGLFWGAMLTRHSAYLQPRMANFLGCIEMYPRTASMRPNTRSTKSHFASTTESVMHSKSVIRQLALPFAAALLLAGLA